MQTYFKARVRVFSSEKMEYTLFVSLLFFFVATPFPDLFEVPLILSFSSFFSFFFRFVGRKEQEKGRKKKEERRGEGT